MKSYFRFLAVTAVVLAACLLLAVAGTSSENEKTTDMLRINNIVQTVKEHWNDQAYLAEAFPDEELLIFSSSDVLIYASKNTKGIDSSASAAMSGYICLPVNNSETFLGTAAVLDPAITENRRMRRHLYMTAAAIYAAVMIVLAAAGLYVTRNIVNPFRRMKLFAGNVAQGELDAPLMMERSNMFGIFTESFDIMRDALRESKRREEAMKQREKELIASLSHDMKTPVTGIKLLCELLEVKTEDPYVISKVQNIAQKAEQLNILVSDLLNSALDELGEMHVNCLDQNAEVLHTLVKEHDTRGLTQEEPVPECLICIDRIRMSQIIANIISNSYKYAGTAIEIRYRFTERFLQMDISDHGGIAEEEIEKITAKFYRGKSNSAEKEGSGLGLYIAAALMEKMNGILRCSGGSEGLTVTLMIPLS